MDNPALPKTPTQISESPPVGYLLVLSCTVRRSLGFKLRSNRAKCPIVHIVQSLQKAPSLSLLRKVTSLSLLSKLSIEVDLLYSGL